MKRLICVKAGMAALPLIVVLAGCPELTQGAEYTVTFDANGGTVTQRSIKVKEGQPALSLPIPTKPSAPNVFNGWYTKNGADNNDWGDSFTVDTPVTDNIQVFARWGDVPLAKYTVNFDPDGGTVAEPQKEALMNDTVDPLPVPAKDGFTFKGWYTARNGEGERFNPGTQVTESITVYAHWIASSTTRITDPARIGTYLAGQSGGQTADAPVPLELEFQLTKDNWDKIITSIENADKFVKLDLALCGASGSAEDYGLLSDGSFDTGGKGTHRVTDIILPEAAGTLSSPFDKFDGLKAVSGAWILTVGDSAFKNRLSLERVDFPQAVSIGKEVFYRCRSLGTVNLPAAESIGEKAFYGCNALTSIAASSSDEALSSTALGTVSFPAAVSIGDSAFSACAALTSVILPKAASIGVSAFFNCDVLRSVSLPAVQSIGGWAFSNCEALESVSFPATIEMWDFEKEEPYDFPAVYSIGGNAFSGCAALTRVTLPGVSSIGDNAFSRCAALTSVTLGEKPPTVGVKLFSGIDAPQDAPQDAHKTITVKIPSGKKEAYGLPDPSAFNNAPGGNGQYADNWGNAFRGKGWDRFAYNPGGNGRVNPYISLVFETYEEGE